jgi:hypothetical protein
MVYTLGVNKFGDIMKKYAWVMFFFCNLIFANVLPISENGCGEMGYLDSCEKVLGLKYLSKCFNDYECQMNCNHREYIVFDVPPEDLCCYH